MRKEKTHRTLCVDFDGVISRYEKYLGKGIFGSPVPGIVGVLRSLLRNNWTIIIYTTRSEEEAIRRYLEEHSVPYHHLNFNPANARLDCSDKKPLADVYLDDRAITFDGNCTGLLEKIENFKPWHKNV